MSGPVRSPRSWSSLRAGTTRSPRQRASPTTTADSRPSPDRDAGEELVLEISVSSEQRSLAVRRDQMASFLGRTLRRGAPGGHVTPPTP